uniref:Uncharacterized protein n=2 Tax=Tetraselmis sp. GSL018 TaxID=582737 RepID=A0A061SDS9_9CHLO
MVNFDNQLRNSYEHAKSSAQVSFRRGRFPRHLHNHQLGACCEFPLLSLWRARMSKYDNCTSVLWTVALFSHNDSSPWLVNIGGSDYVTLPNIPPETNTSCNIAVVSSQVKVQQSERWFVEYVLERELPFLFDMPRSAHSLKILSPRLFPMADFVVYTDVKPELPLFLDKIKEVDFTNKAMLFLRHPERFNSLFLEFEATLQHLVQRSSHHCVIWDMWNMFRLFWFTGILNSSSVYLVPDTVRIVWNLRLWNSDLEDFMCKWNCLTALLSMREQLSVGVALSLSEIDQGILAFV